MACFKVSGNFSSHPAVSAATSDAIALWIRCGSWSAKHLTNGILPRAVVLSMGTEEAANCLVRCNLWAKCRGGWSMVSHVPAAPGTRPIELWTITRNEHRRKIPPAVRLLVFERDEHRCVECAATDDLTLDHIQPWSLGGRETPDNLRVLCRSCNSSKGARVL